MAHIVEFTVSGLAGRKSEYSQRLNRDVNIFFGLNGSGKTSLLKILHSAMQNDGSILRSVPFTRAVVTIATARNKEVTQTISHVERPAPVKSEPSDILAGEFVVWATFRGTTPEDSP